MLIHTCRFGISSPRLAFSKRQKSGAYSYPLVGCDHHLRPVSKRHTSGTYSYENNDITIADLRFPSTEHQALIQTVSRLNWNLTSRFQAPHIRCLFIRADFDGHNSGGSFQAPHIRCLSKNTPNRQLANKGSVISKHQPSGAYSYLKPDFTVTIQSFPSTELRVLFHKPSGQTDVAQCHVSKHQTSGAFSCQCGFRYLSCRTFFQAPHIRRLFIRSRSQRPLSPVFPSTTHPVLIHTDLGNDHGRADPFPSTINQVLIHTLRPLPEASQGSVFKRQPSGAYSYISPRSIYARISVYKHQPSGAYSYPSI